MAEGETTGEIVPYRFEPVSVSNYSDQDTSSSKSESDIREQASFTERLGSTSWCECAKCAPMPSGIECQCCKEMEGVVEGWLRMKAISVSRTTNNLKLYV